MNDDQFLNFFSWTFGFSFLFDFFYLTIFMNRFKQLLIGIIAALLVMSVVASGERNDPWDSLGDLVMILLILCLTGAVIMAIAMWIGAKELLRSKNAGSVTSVSIQAVHSFAVLLSVSNILLVIFVITKLLD